MKPIARMTKDQILQALQDFPDEVTLSEAIERLIFLRKVEIGLEQAESGRTVSLDKVESEILRRSSR